MFTYKFKKFVITDLPLTCIAHSRKESDQYKNHQQGRYKHNAQTLPVIIRIIFIILLILVVIHPVPPKNLRRHCTTCMTLLPL